MNEGDKDKLSGDIVDIGEVRVARSFAGRYCLHRNITYDATAREIHCKDCDRNVDAFDAFMAVVRNYNNTLNSLRVRESRIKEWETKNIILIAAKTVEKAWRSRKYVPTCPHCRRGILPSDGLGKTGVVSKSIENEIRKFETRD